LRASIATALDSSPIPTWATVGTNVIYARQREYGGLIEPKNKSVLHWHSKGKSIFAKSVFQKGSHYMSQGFEASKPTIKEVIEDTAKEIEGYWE